MQDNLIENKEISIDDDFINNNIQQEKVFYGKFDIISTVYNIYDLPVAPESTLIHQQQL